MGQSSSSSTVTLCRYADVVLSTVFERPMVGSHSPPTATRMLEPRAVDAVLWGMPIVSLDALRQAYFRDGKSKYGDIAFQSERLLAFGEGPDCRRWAIWSARMF
jgi:hypothetical protein